MLLIVTTVIRELFPQAFLLEYKDEVEQRHLILIIHTILTTTVPVVDYSKNCNNKYPDHHLHSTPDQKKICTVHVIR